MKDVFGTGLEKLDSIRKEHEVFIKPSMDGSEAD